MPKIVLFLRNIQEFDNKWVFCYTIFSFNNTELVMITLKDINTATFDQTSSEDFEILLKEYVSQTIPTEESKKLFLELVVSAQQDAKRYSKI